jgi:pimeloyl-ACP methyl ester carboxylesterase
MTMSDTTQTRVRRGFVNVAHGQLHYRYAGQGPAVLLLHDSPRSSVMHVPMLQALSRHFTAIAIDTPGYGLSTPLPASPRPEIAEFAAALAAAGAALGIERCPVYGFHTSSKITLQYAIDQPDRVSLAIIDGLNLPPGGPSEAFIERYMKPFQLADDGSHLAVAWAKGRDLFRFFPWFDKSPTARLPLDLPDERFLHGYVLDMLMSREHYATAYSAAMRYLALPRVREVRAPTVFMCRSNDPLYPFLDTLPADLPAHCSIERLGPDADAWRERVTALMLSATSTATELRLPDPLARAGHAQTRGYVNLPQGQLHVRRYGPHDSTQRPCLVLPELPGSTAQTRLLCEALATDRVVYAIDLPGIGESDALDSPEAPGFIDALTRAIDVLGLTSVDVYARFTAAPLALQLARQASNRVHALVLDGLPPAGATERRALWKQYCPPLPPRWDGAHLLSLWHRLRDQELSWPWYERSAAGIRRRVADLDGATLHEATVDLAKQPVAYGDAALAALEIDSKQALRTVEQPTLLFADALDPRDAAVPKLARLARAARVEHRPDSVAQLATAIRAGFTAA